MGIQAVNKRTTNKRKLGKTIATQTAFKVTKAIKNHLKPIPELTTNTIENSNAANTIAMVARPQRFDSGARDNVFIWFLM